MAPAIERGGEKRTDMGSGIRLGRLFGIDIVVDWSLLIIFGLIAFSLGAGLFPRWHPEWSAGLAWMTALAAAVLFFASVLAHELAHALVGRLGGIQVRRITLFMFGGMAQMENEPPSWRIELVMALAGPATSLIVGLLFLWFAGAASGPIRLDPDNPGPGLAALGPVPSLLLWLGPVNIILGVFNLVPAFPLDGGRVLRALLWGATGRLVDATRFASAAGQGFAWLLMATGLLMMLGLRVPFFGTGVVAGLWIAFIGWFLNNAAVASYRQMMLHEVLQDVTVERLMQTRIVRVSPSTPVSTLIETVLMASGQRAFPVEEAGHLVGMVSLTDLHQVARGAWDKLTVGEVMKPLADLATVSPVQHVTDALAMLATRNVNQLPVVEGDRLVGLLRREDVLKWMSLHMQRDGQTGRLA
jgi:Zn-dependent protease/predicted transcriptional regulator